MFYLAGSRRDNENEGPRNLRPSQINQDWNCMVSSIPYLERLDVLLGRDTGAVGDDSSQLAGFQQGVQVEPIKQLGACDVQHEHHFLAGTPQATKGEHAGYVHLQGSEVPRHSVTV